MEESFSKPTPLSNPVETPNKSTSPLNPFCGKEGGGGRKEYEYFLELHNQS